MRQAHRKQILFGAVAAAVLLAGAASAQISGLSDSEVETCLNEGELGKKAGKIVGVTRPVRLGIECSVDIDSVVFKHLDDHRRGLAPKVGGFNEMNFSDCYKYERAAYLLDRELGLHLVPVAVLREVKNTEGTLVAWIPNTTHENRMTKRPTGIQLAELAQRKASMGLFDALILNVDRRVENWLIDENTWELYLIDHSRAFRIRKALPKDFIEKRARLTQDVYEGLEALTETGLSELMGDLISGQQIQALLVRRDLIIEKIDQDAEQWGPAAIFTDWQDDSQTVEIATIGPE